MKVEDIIFLIEGYKEATAEFSQQADQNVVKKLIDAFKDLVNRNQIKGNERNIDWWRKQGWEKFSAFVKDKQNITSSTELKNQRKKVGKSITLDENNEWLIVVPLDKDASCFHGKDTNWCTTKPFSSEFESYFYDRSVTLIYFLNKKTANKWAIAVYDSGELEFFDRNDNSINKDQFKQQTKIDPIKYINAVSEDKNKSQLTTSRDTYRSLVKRGKELLGTLSESESSIEMEKILIKTKHKDLTKEYVNRERDYSPAFQKAMLGIDGELIFILFRKKIEVTEQMQIIAVKQNGRAIWNIIDEGIKPSEAVQIAAVKQNGIAIDYIIEAGITPSEEVQLEAAKQNGIVIDYIIEAGITPSEEVQLEAVKQNGNALMIIIKAGIKPSEEVQIEAVKQHGYAILNIIKAGIKPSEAVQVEAVKRYGNAIDFILNAGITPSEAVQVEAVKQEGYAIQYIIDAGITPSEVVQIAAVKQDGDAIKFIVKAGIKPSRAVKAAAAQEAGRQ